MRELLATTDSRELSEWMAYEQLEPLPGQRGDLQAAVVASTIANVNRGRGTPAWPLSAFVVDYGARHQEQQVVTQIRGAFDVIRRQMAGKR